jgi:hypothetical protein
VTTTTGKSPIVVAKVIIKAGVIDDFGFNDFLHRFLLGDKKVNPLAILSS